MKLRDMPIDELISRTREHLGDKQQRLIAFDSMVIDWQHTEDPAAQSLRESIIRCTCRSILEAQ